jgi:mannosyltransferase
MGAALPGGPGRPGTRVPAAPAAWSSWVAAALRAAGRFAVRAFWLWPALLTAGLGLSRLGGPALWADELATWGAVRLGWGDLFRLLGTVDAVVGPYYVLEKAWTVPAGTSTVALRLPSVAAMAVSAALVAILGARLRDRWVGLLAGLGFALVPATSRYAQEARPYALSVLLAVLATLLLVRLLDRPSTGRVAGYALAVALLGAFHLAGLLLLVGHAVAVLARRVRVVSVRWLVAAAAAVLVLAPLGWAGHRQRTQIDWIGPSHWRTLAGVPAVIFNDDGVGVGLIVLALLGLSRRRPAVLLAGWALGPVLALYVAGKLTPAFWPRYLLFTMPAWVLLAALFLGRVGRVRGLAVLLALGLLGAPVQDAIRQPDGHNHATTQAAAIIATGQRPGDGIVYALHEPVVPWEARDIVARYVPADRRPRDIFAVTPQRLDGRLTAIECADPPGCLAAADPPRIWVLRYQDQTDPLRGLGEPKESLLRSRYRLAHLWLLKGLTVGLLTRAPTG